MVISRLVVIGVLRTDGSEESISLHSEAAGRIIPADARSSSVPLVVPVMRKIVARSARYAAYGAGALVVLCAAAALVLPVFLDTPAVERELQAKLSQAVQGSVAWEKLSLRLLPTPRGALSGFRAEFPGVASVLAEDVDVHLRLAPLFHGRAEIASLSLSKPVIRVEIAPAPPAKGDADAQPDPFDAYRSAVEAIRAFAPEAEVDVENADLDIRIAGMPPLRVRGLEAHASTASKGLKLDLSAAGESWSRLKLSASVDFADLSGAAQLDVAGLKAQPWLDWLLDGLPVGVALPAASVRAGARTDGKSRLEGDVDLRAGSVEILRAAERVQLPDVALAGKVGLTGKEISLQLSSARLGAVRLAGGSFRYSLKDGYTSGVSQFDLDLAQVMDGVRRLMPENARGALARLPITGRAQGRATFNLEDSSWGALIEVRESDSSIGIEGLPGPVMVKRFGNPAVATPRYVRGPAAHFSRSVLPVLPRMSMLSKAPVMASNPVANTRLSSSYSASRVWRPWGVIASMGARRRSTRVTLSRLKVS